MKFVKPKNKHVEGLVLLSKNFSKEFHWARSVPIGTIDTKEKARKKLFGDDVVEALVAEDNDRVVGFLNVFKYDEDNQEKYGASILISNEYRGMGLGKKLCDKVFKGISNDIEVEAWVVDFNEHSMMATPKMGFKLQKSFTVDDYEPLIGRIVHIFSRRGEFKE